MSALGGSGGWLPSVAALGRFRRTVRSRLGAVVLDGPADGRRSTQLNQSAFALGRALAVPGSQPPGRMGREVRLDPADLARRLDAGSWQTQEQEQADATAMNAPVALTSQLPCEAPGPIQPSTNGRVQHRPPRQD